MTADHAGSACRPMCRLAIEEATSPLFTVRRAACVIDSAAGSATTQFEGGRDPEADGELERMRRHDLKNESAAIKVGLAVLKQCMDRGDNAQASEFLETLLEQADRLDEQIEAYAATRQAGSGQVDLVSSKPLEQRASDFPDGSETPAAAQRILFLSSDRATREAFCDLCAGSVFSAVATDDADDALAWLSRQDEVAGVFCDGDYEATPRVLASLVEQTGAVLPTCELVGVSPTALDGESTAVRSAFVDAISRACRLA